MKKIFTLIFAVAAMASSAQSLRLFYNGQIINNADTIEVSADLNTLANTFIEYANISDDDVYFKVSKEDLQLTTGSTISFCVGGTCYGGNISQEIFLMQGDTVTTADETNVFHATYNTTAQGTSLVKYTFYNTSDQEDKVSVIIRYSTGVGVHNVTSNEISLRAYPNPATTGVTLAYTFNNARNGQLVIKNLAGMEMYRSSLSSTGKMYVNTSDFRSGVYFYGIEVNGNMLYTKKLLIK